MANTTLMKMGPTYLALSTYFGDDVSITLEFYQDDTLTTKEDVSTWDMRMDVRTYLGTDVALTRDDTNAATGTLVFSSPWATFNASDEFIPNREHGWDCKRQDNNRTVFAGPFHVVANRAAT